MSTPQDNPGRLSVVGSYDLEEHDWTNPLPHRAVDASALRAYWVRIVTCCVRGAKRRASGSRLSETPENAALYAGFTGPQYTGKVELKTAFSVVVRLHKILAPDAAFVCDETCPHLASGATPDQAKRFLDTLDHAYYHAKKRREGCPHHMVEDLLNEGDVYYSWRREFAEMIGGASIAPAPTPDPTSDLVKEKPKGAWGLSLGGVVIHAPGETVSPEEEDRRMRLGIANALRQAYEKMGPPPPGWTGYRPPEPGDE